MPFDPGAHPRAPAGYAAGGQFTAGSSSAAPTNEKPVQQGETGERVTELQKRLNALGAKPPLSEDGKFGPRTLAAVRAFQKSHGLKVDGLVGPKTTAALRRPRNDAEKVSALKGQKRVLRSSAGKAS